MPKTATKYYCSAACAKIGSRSYIYPRDCKWCGTHFTARHANAEYCNNRCAVFAYRVDTGRVKKIAPPVFDYLVTAPVNDAWRDRLTEQKLDWLFMEAGCRITGEARIAAQKS